MKKKDLVKENINANPGLLACPVCRGVLHASDSYALVCPNRHSFDMASAGCINLLTSPVKSEYGADMLESRQRVCLNGFFDGLISQVANVISAQFPVGKRDFLRILDAGCGEGTQLDRLLESLTSRGVNNITGIGIDISKEGIRIAAREYPGILWLVADLARLPLENRSVDVILNSLSPSNYSEFDRVLKDDGLLIKAVPGENYLKELRQLLYPGDDREQYSNDKVISLFENKYEVLEKRHIQQSFSVPQRLWPHIVAMTPLAWGAGASRATAVMEEPQENIALDFLVLVGRKRKA